MLYSQMRDKETMKKEMYRDDVTRILALKTPQDLQMLIAKTGHTASVLTTGL